MSAPAVKHRPQITAQPQQTDSSRMRTSSRTTESSRMRGLRRNASSLIRATLPAAFPPGALPGRTMRPGIARCCRPGGRTRRPTTPLAPTRSRAGRTCANLAAVSRRPAGRRIARACRSGRLAAARGVNRRIGNNTARKTGNVPAGIGHRVRLAAARGVNRRIGNNTARKTGNVPAGIGHRVRLPPPPEPAQSLTYSITPPPADILRAIFGQIQETLARRIHLPR
jgi:hypothetical protein